MSKNPESHLAQEEERKESLPPLPLFEKTISEIETKTGKKVTGLDKWKNYQEINDKLNGRVAIEEKWFPVINGQLIEEINGKKITFACDIQNIDGKLNGRVWIEREEVEVVLGKLVF